MIPIGQRALAWITRYRGEVRPSLVREPDTAEHSTRDATPGNVLEIRRTIDFFSKFPILGEIPNGAGATSS
jgi:hypothetical protein